MGFGYVTDFCVHTRLCFKAFEYCNLLGEDWREQQSSQLEILQLNYWSPYIALERTIVNAISLPTCRQL